MPFAIHYRANFSCQKSSYRWPCILEGFFLHKPGNAGAQWWRVRMLEPNASQMSPDEEANDSSSNRAPKKRGSLATTLDQELEPRLPPGQPGRPRGTSNYEWTPETDRLLLELCARSGTAKAKRIVGRKIQEDRPAGAAPRPDSVRKAVERRMASWEFPPVSGEKNRKRERLNPGQNVRQEHCWVLLEPTRISNRSPPAQVTA